MNRKTFFKVAGISVAGLVGGGAAWGFATNESSAGAATVDNALNGRYRLFHRGTGANNVWIAPEHTIEGYRLAERMGAIDIDLDVQATADGILVCHHDVDLQRSANIQRLISSYTFNQLPEVDWSATVGAGWGKQRIPAFEDVLREFGGRVLLDVEPKESAELQQLVELIDRYKLKQSVIINSADPDVIKAAADRGMFTHCWGISSTHMIDVAADAGANIVQLLYSSLTPSIVEYAQAKKSTSQIRHVLCGPVQRRHERDLAIATGVDSFVNDAIGYLDATPQATTLSGHIASQKVGPGWWSNYSPYDNNYAGGILDTVGIRLSRAGTFKSRFVLLGDFCGAKSPFHSIEFSWRASEWDGAQVRPAFMFGLLDDRGDGTVASIADGYQTYMRANGEIQLSKISNGVENGLGTLLTAPQISLDEAKLKVYVTPEKLAVVRTDVGAAALSEEVVTGTVDHLDVQPLSAEIVANTSLRLPNGQYVTVSGNAPVGAIVISVAPFDLHSRLKPKALVLWALGPYEEAAYRGDYIWVGGSTPGNGNGSNIWLTDLTYTQGDR